MNLRSKKRMAADVLKVGVNRIRLDPGSTDILTDAITKDNVRALIKEGLIRVSPVNSVSRGRFRNKAVTRKKHGSGAGSREGRKTARMGKKQRWVMHVRTIRRRLKVMRDRGEITSVAFKRLYLQVKGGQVRSLKHLTDLVKEQSRR